MYVPISTYCTLPPILTHFSIQTVWHRRCTLTLVPPAPAQVLSHLLPSTKQSQLPGTIVTGGARLQLAMNIYRDFDTGPFSSNSNAYPTTTTNMADVFKQRPLPPHSSHPNFAHLTLLVFQAVMEVVFLALPGYILAERGLFDVAAQKFAANINVNLFTPCLSTLCRTFPSSLLNIASSLLQTLFEAPTRRPPRSRPHPPHIRYSDTGLLWMCQVRIVVVRLEEARNKLRGCHGCADASYPNTRHKTNARRYSATQTLYPSPS